LSLLTHIPASQKTLPDNSNFYYGNRNISLFETLAAYESIMTKPMPGAVPEWEFGQLPRALFCVPPLA